MTADHSKPTSAQDMACLSQVVRYCSAAGTSPTSSTLSLRSIRVLGQFLAVDMSASKLAQFGTTHVAKGIGRLVPEVIESGSGSYVSMVGGRKVSRPQHRLAS